MPQYSDIDWQLRQDKSGDVGIAVDYTSLDQSIKDRLITQKKQRFHRPNYGSRLEEAFGMPQDESTRQWVVMEVKRTLRAEPRIEVVDVGVEFVDQHSMIITVGYTSTVLFSENAKSVDAEINNN